MSEKQGGNPQVDRKDRESSSATHNNNLVKDMLGGVKPKIPNNIVGQKPKS